jgi:polyhydroxybutyrate depolymerase
MDPTKKYGFMGQGGGSLEAPSSKPGFLSSLLSPKSAAKLAINGDFREGSVEKSAADRMKESDIGIDMSLDSDSNKEKVVSSIGGEKGTGTTATTRTTTASSLSTSTNSSSGIVSSLGMDSPVNTNANANANANAIGNPNNHNHNHNSTPLPSLLSSSPLIETPKYGVISPSMLTSLTSYHSTNTNVFVSDGSNSNIPSNPKEANNNNNNNNYNDNNSNCTLPLHATVVEMTVTKTAKAEANKNIVIDICNETTNLTNANANSNSNVVIDESTGAGVGVGAGANSNNANVKRKGKGKEYDYNYTLFPNFDNKMKRFCNKYKKITSIIISFLLIVLVFILVFMNNNDNNNINIKIFNHNGVVRQYVYHGPDKKQGNKQPLIAVIPNSGEFTSSTIELLQYNNIADQNNFGVVYPLGMIVQEGDSNSNSNSKSGPGSSGDSRYRRFNVNYNGNSNSQATDDDSDFIMDLMLYISSEYSFDINKLFVTGYGNGGDMCYILACKYSNLLSAISSVAGTMYESVKLSKYCNEPDTMQLAKNSPIYSIHGKIDQYTKWDGGISIGNGIDATSNGPYMSQINILNYWKERYDCIVMNTNTISNEGIGNSGINKLKYSSCHQGGSIINNPIDSTNSQLWLDEVIDGDHNYNLYGTNEKTSKAVWDFFQLYI